MVSAISEERPKPKNLLFKSLSGHMEVLISLLPVFLTQPDMLDQLMSFFLTVFNSLKSQVCARACVCVCVCCVCVCIHIRVLAKASYMDPCTTLLLCIRWGHGVIRMQYNH